MLTRRSGSGHILEITGFPAPVADPVGAVSLQQQQRT
jgi:hypothetical protein